MATIAVVRMRFAAEIKGTGTRHSARFRPELYVRNTANASVVDVRDVDGSAMEAGLSLMRS